MNNKFIFTPPNRWWSNKSHNVQIRFPDPQIDSGESSLLGPMSPGFGHHRNRGRYTGRSWVWSWLTGYDHGSWMIGMNTNDMTHHRVRESRAAGLTVRTRSHRYSGRDHRQLCETTRLMGPGQILQIYSNRLNFFAQFVYSESIKQELKVKPSHECRWPCEAFEWSCLSFTRSLTWWKSIIVYITLVHRLKLIPDVTCPVIVTWSHPSIETTTSVDSTWRSWSRFRGSWKIATSVGYSPETWTGGSFFFPQLSFSLQP
jgi:hypothetical protein